MRKLNRKGFTLVELLAVIIILAIVVGITIPAVLTTTSKAKTKAFKTAAQTAADWVDRQYQVMSTGLSDTEIATLDSNFTNNAACGTNAGNCTATGGKDITLASFIVAAGLTTDNVASINVYIDSNTGRSCVILTAGNKSDYKGAGEDTSLDANKNKMKGGSC